MSIPPINPPQGDLREWAQTVTNRLQELIQKQNRPDPTVVQLEHRTPGAKALEDGLMMWDATQKCPVVSEGGVWRKVSLV